MNLQNRMLLQIVLIIIAGCSSILKDTTRNVGSCIGYSFSQTVTLTELTHRYYRVTSSWPKTISDYETFSLRDDTLAALLKDVQSKFDSLTFHSESTNSVDIGFYGKPFVGDSLKIDVFIGVFHFDSDSAKNNVNIICLRGYDYHSVGGQIICGTSKL